MTNYVDGVAYYAVSIKHFGDDLTPWTSDGNQTTTDEAYINLTQFLSEGRIAYDIRNYGAQEYLDREYNYHLNLFLQGNKWKYCDIVVNVLGWARRKENIEL